MSKYIRKILLSEDEIRQMVEKVGKNISRDYAGKKPVLIGVLKGSLIFMADLMRALDIPCTIDFLSVSSYSGTKSSGIVKINRDVDCEIEGRDVILVEDVVDTGLTLDYLRELLLQRKPASIAVCAAFDKPECRKIPVTVEYVGAVIPNEFVVGYGLDYNQDYRELPYLAVLADKEECE